MASIPISEILAASIRRIRKNKGWTQNDLAVKSGVSFRGIQDIEAGKRSPRPETLKALAGALGVDAAEFYKEAIVFSKTQEIKSAETGSKIDLSPDAIADAVVSRLNTVPALTEEESDAIALLRRLSSKQRAFYIDQIRRAVILSESKDVTEVVRKGK